MARGERQRGLRNSCGIGEICNTCQPGISFAIPHVDVTPQAEYAASYSPPNNTGERVVLLCLTVVGNTYPISRKTDYAHPDKFVGGSVSCFHYQHPVPFDPTTGIFDTRKATHHKSDKGMKAGFDSHFVSVARHTQYQAVDSMTEYDYDELVVKEAAQILPIAAVYFNK